MVECTCVAGGTPAGKCPVHGSTWRRLQWVARVPSAEEQLRATLRAVECDRDRLAQEVDDLHAALAHVRRCVDVSHGLDHPWIPGANFDARLRELLIR